MQFPDTDPQALSGHVLANNGRGVCVTSSLAWLNRACPANGSQAIEEHATSLPWRALGSLDVEQ